MAFVNDLGMNISFDSSELIEELKEDIAEFGGDTVVAVWCRKTHGVTLYTNYDFIDEKNPIKPKELKDNEHIEKMSMSALLVLLEKQDDIMEN